MDHAIDSIYVKSGSEGNDATGIRGESQQRHIIPELYRGGGFFGLRFGKLGRSGRLRFVSPFFQLLQLDFGFADGSKILV